MLQCSACWAWCTGHCSAASCNRVFERGRAPPQNTLSLFIRQSCTSNLKILSPIRAWGVLQKSRLWQLAIKMMVAHCWHRSCSITEVEADSPSLSFAQRSFLVPKACTSTTLKNWFLYSREASVSAFRLFYTLQSLCQITLYIFFWGPSQLARLGANPAGSTNSSLKHCGPILMAFSDSEYNIASKTGWCVMACVSTMLQQIAPFRSGLPPIKSEPLLTIRVASCSMQHAQVPNTRQIQHSVACRWNSAIEWCVAASPSDTKSQHWEALALVHFQS